MKLYHFILSVALVSCSSAPEATRVAIHNSTSGAVYFQPEGAMSYGKLSTADTVFSPDNTIPAYYTVMDGRQRGRTVYIAPGTSTDITVTDDGITIDGDLRAENDFINENVYLCRTPEGIKPYSKEWADFQSAEVARLASKLDSAGLDDRFTKIQKLYYNGVFADQRLSGAERERVFNDPGSDTQLAEGYYDFLKDEKFDDADILSVPKWFEIVNNSLENMEREGYLPVSNDNYMYIYAARIGNETVRSKYLTRLLELVLKKGYTNDFTTQIDKISGYILPEDSATVNMLADSCKKMMAAQAPVARGVRIPDFTAKTVNGKEYAVKDFRGKITVIDFWYTGCVPCKAEVPYFESLAKEFDGKDVQFLSVSLDTGDELYDEWKKIMTAKPASSKVLGVNLPDGFNSPLLGKLQINKVPRIMLIDKDGNIVDSYAKRPSDPKLREQLNSLLAR